MGANRPLVPTGGRGRFVAGVAGVDGLRHRPATGRRGLAASGRYRAGGLRQGFRAADARGRRGRLLIGVPAAWLTSIHEFPGRRLFEWALLLPMAIPAYIIAYTYTGLLDFAGPVQTALRDISLEPSGLLVSRNPLAAGGGGHAGAGAVSLRLSAGAGRVSRPVGRRAGSQPHLGAGPWRRFSRSRCRWPGPR